MFSEFFSCPVDSVLCQIRIIAAGSSPQMLAQAVLQECKGCFPQGAQDQPTHIRDHEPYFGWLSGSCDPFLMFHQHLDFSITSVASLSLAHAIPL